MFDQNLYSKLGEAVVAFERLISDLKSRLALYYGFNAEVMILLDPYSARQTIDRFADLLKHASRQKKVAEEDIDLYQWLVKDLQSLNIQRNLAVHSAWSKVFIDGQFTGKTVGHKSISPLKFESYDITPELFDNVTRKSLKLHEVVWTTGSLDNMMGVDETNGLLSSCWDRNKDGEWIWILQS